VNNDAVLLLLALLGGGLGGGGTSLFGGGGKFDLLRLYGILEVFKALMARRRETRGSGSWYPDPITNPDPDPNRQGQQQEV
jgi:hypothetical protein